MADLGISESGSLSVTVKPKDEWAKMMAAVKEDGSRVAKCMREQGRRLEVGVLAPKYVQSEDTVPVSGVFIDLDWKIATKLEMVESARDMITKAYILSSLDPAFPTVLRSIIEGKGLYEHSIGEFFQLYGQFEGKYQLTKGRQTRDTMDALVNGDKKYLKLYQERGESRLYPLPYAVRNILAHTGHNPNMLDPEGKELRTAIELLRSWVAPEK